MIPAPSLSPTLSIWSTITLTKTSPLAREPIPVTAGLPLSAVSVANPCNRKGRLKKLLFLKRVVIVGGVFYPALCQNSLLLERDERPPFLGSSPKGIGMTWQS